MKVNLAQKLNFNNYDHKFNVELKCSADKALLFFRKKLFQYEKIEKSLITG